MEKLEKEMGILRLLEVGKWRGGVGGYGGGLEAPEMEVVTVDAAVEVGCVSWCRGEDEDEVFLLVFDWNFVLER